MRGGVRSRRGPRRGRVGAWAMCMAVLGVVGVITVAHRDRGRAPRYSPAVLNTTDSPAPRMSAPVLLYGTAWCVAPCPVRCELSFGGNIKR